MKKALTKTERTLLERARENPDRTTVVEAGSYRVSNLQWAKRYSYGRREWAAADRLVARGLAREVSRNSWVDAMSSGNTRIIEIIEEV